MVVDARRWSLTAALAGTRCCDDDDVLDSLGCSVGLRDVRLSSDAEGDVRVGKAGGTRPSVLLRRRMRNTFDMPSDTVDQRGEACCGVGGVTGNEGLPLAVCGGGDSASASSTVPKSGDGGRDDGGVSMTCRLWTCDEDEWVPVPDDDVVDDTELLRSTSATPLLKAPVLMAVTLLLGRTACGAEGVPGRTSMVGRGVGSVLGVASTDATRLSCPPSPPSRSRSRSRSRTPRRLQLAPADRGGTDPRLPVRSASAVSMSGKAGREREVLMPTVPLLLCEPVLCPALRIALAQLRPRSLSGVAAIVVVVVKPASPSPGALLWWYSAACAASKPIAPRNSARSASAMPTSADDMRRRSRTLVAMPEPCSILCDEKGGDVV